MEKQRALGLQKQLAELHTLSPRADDTAFQKWRQDTRVVLGKVFGDDSDRVNDFEGIWFRAGILTRDKARQRRMDEEAFSKDSRRAQALLESGLTEIDEFFDESVQTARSPAKPELFIKTLCTRFHLMARQLRDRHKNRPTLDVEDEYDVQDLLCALLRIEFEDTRPEERWRGARKLVPDDWPRNEVGT